MDDSFLYYKESKGWLRKEDVPTSFGLYAIFVNNPGNLPPEWQTLIERNYRLLYIGKAEKVCVSGLTIILVANHHLVIRSKGH